MDLAICLAYIVLKYDMSNLNKRDYNRIMQNNNTLSWKLHKAKELYNIVTGKSNTQDQIVDVIYLFYIRSDIPVENNKYLLDCEAVITI